MALAPDSDDHDDARAVTIDGEGGSPSLPTPAAALPGPEDASGSGAEGGDADTEGATDTLGDGDADTPDAAVLAAEAGDAGTENLDEEVVQPPDDSATAHPDTGSADAGAWEATEADAWSGDVATEEGHLSDDRPLAGQTGVTPEAPEPVGFDGRPMLPDDDGAPADEATDGSDHAVLRRRSKAVVVLTVLSLVVVGAGVGALIWGRSRSGTGAAPPPQTQASPSRTLSDGAFETFNDPETGFTIRYPRSWTKQAAPLREVRLRVTDANQYAAQVRVTRNEVVTTPANLANIKAVTDGIVGPGVQILKQEAVTVNGLIGFHYIYTFTDTDSGLTSAQDHYFLFQGHKMNSIVFQALPTESFDRMEPVFQQMLGSFHSDPEPP